MIVCLPAERKSRCKGPDEGTTCVDAPIEYCKLLELPYAHFLRAMQINLLALFLLHFSKTRLPLADVLDFAHRRWFRRQENLQTLTESLNCSSGLQVVVVNCVHHGIRNVVRKQLFGTSDELGVNESLGVGPADGSICKRSVHEARADRVHADIRVELANGGAELEDRCFGCSVAEGVAVGELGRKARAKSPYTGMCG